MSKCLLTFRSQTLASKAAKTLGKSGKNVSVVSVDPSVTSKGCGWGIESECNGMDEIERILKQKGITYGEWLSGGF